MKTAGSELKDRLYAAKRRTKELEESSSSLQQSLEATQAQLSKVEGFKAEFVETDEDSL